MLAPNERHLYVDALKPPLGYVLGQAVATTYSLDLATLLSVPLALALPHLDVRSLGQESAIALLQATRQVSSRLTVFCDRTGIGAPVGSHVLYGLLEPALYEVSAPHGGSLHAKVWMLRYDPEEDDGSRAQMRLVVLSRNLTFDRSWDVSVRLDGLLTGRNRKQNQPLVELLRTLPERCLRTMPEAKKVQLASFSDELAKAEWELPGGFDELSFALLGAGKRPRTWVPDASERLVVISPFVSEAALRSLVETTAVPVALISRAEELDHIDRELLGAFESVYTLHDAAEREDGADDDGSPLQAPLRGLHAKVYLAKHGWNTRLCLGSANATNAALLAGQNIELMVELVGKTSAVPGKGIDGMLSKDGLLEILTPYDASLPVSEPDALQEHADATLRDAARVLSEATLSIEFVRDESLYRVTLVLSEPVTLGSISEVSAWLVTMDPSTACEAHELFEKQQLSLQPCAPESATSFVAFRLMVPGASAPLTFVRNLPTTSMPADRDAHVMRVVVNNRDRFFRYLLGLLDGFEHGFGGDLEGEGGATASRSRSQREAGLLERLVRTRARHPDRLESIQTVIDALQQSPEGTAILSEEFVAVWKVIQEARS